MATATLDPRTDTVAKISRQHLMGHIRFEAVKAVSMTDHYGDEYFQVWVVYDSKAEMLDPRFTKGLYQRMRPELLEHGIDCDVSHSFVDREERGPWSELFHASPAPDRGK